MAAFDQEREEEAANKQHPPADLLNENHRRVLAGTLRRGELADGAWRISLSERNFPNLLSPVSHIYLPPASDPYSCSCQNNCARRLQNLPQTTSSRLENSTLLEPLWQNFRYYGVI